MSGPGPSPAPSELEIDEAARVLRLPAAGVEALVGAGYLHPAAVRDGRRLFALGDLKAFVARNVGADPAHSLEGLFSGLDPADPDGLIAALDGRSADMASRAFDIFAQVFPEATSWGEGERARFINQAAERFEAILSVTAMGEEIDRDLMADLEDIGAAAARSGSPLPQLLVILRISRDLVVQTAVELTEERGRHWGLALSLVLTRVLPAIDRLTDALAQGYWAAVVGREEDMRARFESVVEQASDGIFEIDPDGTIQYANDALARILGLSRADLEGVAADAIFGELGMRELGELLASSPGAGASLRIRRPDGQQRVVEVHTFARQEVGELVGHQGVVHDITAADELEERKNELLRLVSNELRQPLTTILGLGVTLAAYADDLPAARLRRIGHTIHQHGERLTRLTDDLYDLSLLASRDLVVNPRAVRLVDVVDAALSLLAQAPNVVRVDVPADLEVVADRRRLERALATLLEHSSDTGIPPVEVAADQDEELVHIHVDHAGEPPAAADMQGTADATLAAPGLGLPLVQGLLEAMGGHVALGGAPEGGTRVRVSLRRPLRRV